MDQALRKQKGRVQEKEQVHGDVVLPMDVHNRKLVANVHPPDWVNPDPAPCYNLVVVGAGTAGLVAAAGAAGLGARVALVERHLLGGDCLNVGCVPSKAVIRASRASADVLGAPRFGVRAEPGAKPDFAAAMERMRKVRADISRHDSAGRFRELGVDVFLGEAVFSGPKSVEVGGAVLRFKKAVIATGARPIAPPIEGLKEAGYLTNETVFNLTERPGRIAFLGAGPISCELAQAFRRLGSEVTMLDRAPHVLIREDADVAEVLQDALRREGVRLVLGCKVERVEVGDGGKMVHFTSREGEKDSVGVDEILVGVGRAPNVEGLGLEEACVAFDPRRGVTVDDRLRTTNRHIYAAGDCCMEWKFTHAADAAARIVIQNALFFGRKKRSALTMPWCTYTSPEVAHVGLYEEDAAKRGIPVETFVRHLRDVDRAVADGETEGFVKVHVKRGSDEILGATIVAAHAGEMISEVTLAMAGKIGLKKLAAVIHPYPTRAEAIKQVADAYNRTRLTPRTRRWLERFMEWRRSHRKSWFDRGNSCPDPPG